MHFLKNHPSRAGAKVKRQIRRMEARNKLLRARNLRSESSGARKLYPELCFFLSCVAVLCLGARVTQDTFDPQFNRLPRVVS